MTLSQRVLHWTWRVPLAGTTTLVVALGLWRKDVHRVALGGAVLTAIIAVVALDEILRRFRLRRLRIALAAGIVVRTVLQPALLVFDAVVATIVGVALPTWMRDYAAGSVGGFLMSIGCVGANIILALALGGGILPLSRRLRARLKIGSRAWVMRSAIDRRCEVKVDQGRPIQGFSVAA